MSTLWVDAAKKSEQQMAGVRKAVSILREKLKRLESQVPCPVMEIKKCRHAIEKGERLLKDVGGCK